MNDAELAKEWTTVRDTVITYEGINESQVKAFFDRLKPQAMSADFLMLTAANDFIKTWIETHYIDYIHRALREIHGADFTVMIAVDANQEDAPQADEGLQATGAEKQPVAQTPQTGSLPQDDDRIEVADKIPSLSEDHTISQEQVELRDDGRENREEKSALSSISTLTFENFVIGESNKMAYSMAVAVAEEPGRPILNPLFIYGRSGLGKTHLMRAIQNYVNETRPELKTVYVDSADFLAGYVEATVAHDTQKSSYRNFKNQYQDADILLISISCFRYSTEWSKRVSKLFYPLTEHPRT